MRPGTGRETGLGHVGGRAPKVGALGDAGAIAEWNPGKGPLHGPGDYRGQIIGLFTDLLRILTLNHNPHQRFSA